MKRLIAPLIIILFTAHQTHGRSSTVRKNQEHRVYDTFEYKGDERISLSKGGLKNVKVLYNKTNPLIGYIAIPVEMRTQKKHGGSRKYLGTVSDSETQYHHVFLREDPTAGTY